MKNEMNKCPVCGAKERIIKITQKGRVYYYGECRNKYCTGETRTDFYDAPEQAAEEWNRMVNHE